MINNQYMKNLVSYINENNTSINEAKDVNELKKLIQNAKHKDVIDYLYAIVEYKENNIGKYDIIPVLRLIKLKNDIFAICGTEYFDAGEAIGEICKEQGWGYLKMWPGKLPAITVNNITIDRAIQMIDIFPKYFSDFMNRSHNSCCKYLSFNYDEICKQYEKIAKPYKTGNVETEINLIEYKIKCLKKELDDLKKYEKY